MSLAYEPGEATRVHPRRFESCYQRLPNRQSINFQDGLPLRHALESEGHVHFRDTLRDGVGNVMSVAATADSDLAEGTVVRVVTTRDLNLVVAPAEP